MTYKVITISKVISWCQGVDKLTIKAHWVMSLKVFKKLARRMGYVSWYLPGCERRKVWKVINWCQRVDHFTSNHGKNSSGFRTSLNFQRYSRSLRPSYTIPLSKFITKNLMYQSEINHGENSSGFRTFWNSSGIQNLTENWGSSVIRFHS